MDIKMRMLWRFFAMAIVVSVLLGGMETANAEQAKAEEYRRILSSGKFYLEYGVVMDYGNPKLNKRMNDGGKKILAADGEKRVSYTKGGRMGDSFAVAQSQSSPFYAKIAKESMSGFNKLRPDILCANGNFYLFCGKNKAIRATADQLLEDELEMYWYQIENMVGLPKYFRALLPETFNQSLAQTVLKSRAEWAEAHPKLAARSGKGVTASFESEVVESGKKELFGQTMSFDRYILRSTSEEIGGVKPGTGYRFSETGDPIAMPDPSYEFYYDDAGNLRYIREVQELPPDVRAQQEARRQMYRASSPLGATAISNDMYIRIDKISGEVPGDMFEIPKGCAVYAADTGTIDDLLGNPTLVEQH